jgi:hypothetical protein
MYRYCPIQKNCRYRGPPERHFKPQAAFRKSERNDTEPMVEETSRDVRKHYAAFGDKADIVFPFIREITGNFLDIIDSVAGVKRAHASGVYAGNSL